MQTSENYRFVLLFQNISAQIQVFYSVLIIYKFLLHKIQPPVHAANLSGHQSATTQATSCERRDENHLARSRGCKVDDQKRPI